MGIDRLTTVAIDTETTGLDVHSAKVQTTHMSYWTSTGNGTAFPVTDERKYTALRKLAKRKKQIVAMFNAKFDMRMLAKAGVRARGIVLDVLLMAQMMLPEEKKKNLKHLSRKFLNDPYIEEIKLKQWLRINREKIYGKAPAHIILPYALADARRTLELFYYLSAAFDKYHMWHVLEREMLLMRRVVMPMENVGIGIDLDEVARLKNGVKGELKTLKDKLVKLTGNPTFNPNSGAQVAKAIYGKGSPPTRFSRKTGKPKTDIIALLESTSKAAPYIIRYRKIAKAQTTYLKKFTQPVLHTTLNQNGASTGRFSSSDPNLQNIPRPDEDTFLGQLRKVVVARPGYFLLFVDFSQIEMRWAAHYSGQQHMIDAINAGEDLHDRTCIHTFAKKPTDSDWDTFRYLSKTFNFSVLYGAGPAKIAETILKNTDGKRRFSPHQISSYLSTYKSRHDKIMLLFSDVATEVARTGGVRNYYGRFVQVDPNKTYAGVNYKIQGSAADFLKFKMFAVANYIRNTGIRLLLQVHDELIFEVPRDQKKRVRGIVDLMEDRTLLKVPLTCSASYGMNWFDKKKVVFK